MLQCATGNVGSSGRSAKDSSVEERKGIDRETAEGSGKTSRRWVVDIFYWKRHGTLRLLVSKSRETFKATITGLNVGQCRPPPRPLHVIPCRNTSFHTAFVDLEKLWFAHDILLVIFPHFMLLPWYKQNKRFNFFRFTWLIILFGCVLINTNLCCIFFSRRRNTECRYKSSVHLGYPEVIWQTEQAERAWHLPCWEKRHLEM